MKSNFELLWSEGSRRFIKKLDKATARRILTAAQLLADNPFPPQSKRMTGFPELHRVRVGNYRLIYRVKQTQLVITVVKVGHRRDVYRGLGD